MAESRNRSSHGVAPALLNVCGTALIAAVIVLCLPLVALPAAGIGVYEVVSGSMEPQIPTGSAVFVGHVDAQELREGEVIAFQDGGGIVTHRVLANDAARQQLQTKGDANEVEDLHPVAYSSVVGRVLFSIPGLGSAYALISSLAGKVVLLLVAAFGVVLNVAASRLRALREIPIARGAARPSGEAYPPAVEDLHDRR